MSCFSLDGVGRIFRQAFRDFLGYLAEYIAVLGLCCGRGQKAQSLEAWPIVQTAVDKHDVAIFKWEGCGFCKRAQEHLDENAKVDPSKLSVIEADSPVEAVLRDVLWQPLMTFPVIFVRGVYLGGLDQLEEAIDSGQFDELMDVEQKPFPTGVGLKKDPLRLLSGPYGQPWYCFQLYVYANWVRLISVVQIICMALAIALTDTYPIVAVVLLWLVAIDMIIFTVLGPAPIAPISTLVTISVWRFRGQAVSSLPYKIMIGILYTMSWLSISTCVFDSTSCKSELQNSRLLLAGLISNSVLLAVLRL